MYSLHFSLNMRYSQPKAEAVLGFVSKAEGWYSSQRCLALVATAIASTTAGIVVRLLQLLHLCKEDN